MAKKRTKAQRSAAAKRAWELRRLRSAKTPTPIDTPVLGAEAPGYASLQRELGDAYEQSSAGKGKERHANGRPFDRQPIMEMGRLYGFGFQSGQAAKKVQEAIGMHNRGDVDKAVHEVHGAIVYLAALASLMRETLPATKPAKK
jgi:hypothetical protein